MFSGPQGVLDPPVPYQLVLLLSQHMQAKMAQLQCADGMMAGGCLGSPLEDREREEGRQIGQRAGRRWVRNKIGRKEIKDKQVQEWNKTKENRN